MKALVLLISLLISFFSFARDPLPGSRYESLSGIETSKEGKKGEKEKDAKKVEGMDKTPSAFLANNFDFLPPGAHVLDLDMGDGRNAVFLARKGFKVTGLEDNEEAYKNAKTFAKEVGVRIDAILGDRSTHQFPNQSFDVIMSFHHVDKKVIERMKNWLRPGGYMIYEAVTEQELNVPKGELSVKSGELLKLFGDYRILKYEEPIHRKEFKASIILKKE